MNWIVHGVAKSQTTEGLSLSFKFHVTLEEVWFVYFTCIYFLFIALHAVCAQSYLTLFDPMNCM